MTNRFTPFLPNEIKIGGEIRSRMDRTADKILHHLEVEHYFLRHFQKRSEKPEVPGGFSGYGMLLDAVVKAAAYGIGGDEMLRFKERRFAEIIATQSAEGAITIYSGEPGYWDNHEQAYMIQAFVLDHRWFGNKESLRTALRLGEFLIGRKTGVNLGLETAFLMLFEETGDERFLDYCRNEFKLAESLDTYDRMTPVNGIAHVYTYAARALAQLQLGLPEGAEALFERVLRGGYSSVSGSCSGGFYWGEVWDDSQTGLGHWGETCASAYLLRAAAAMSGRTGETVYGDLFERILHNAFVGAQSGDGLRQRYFIPFNEPGEWYEHETYCCPNNLRRMMFELPGAVYFKTPEGVAVNLYTDSELRSDDLEITQKTGYPEAETVELTVKAAGEMTLRLRIPRWCQTARIAVEGKELTAPGGDWFRLTRDWRQGVTLRLTLPMPLRLIRGTMAQTGRAAVMKGPLVYAVEMERNRLSRHAMDLLTFHAPEQAVAEEEGIRIPCVIPNQAHPEPEVLFTRFSNEKRTRTYFPVAKGHPLLTDDELFRSHPNESCEIDESQNSRNMQNINIRRTV